MRIGAVSYLNTKPLVEGLDRTAVPGDSSTIDLTFDLPSRLADRLSAAELDVALIPAVEFFRGDDYTIISDACIASLGPVWSVRVLFRVPPAEVKTLALDEGSRTSAALTQILLYENYRISPQTVSLPIDADWHQADADAILIIGDRAMKPIAGEWAANWDIGQKWKQWSGSPCVFAMWVARAGFESQELADVLSQTRDHGLAIAEQIAAREAATYGLSYEMCLRYFREFLHFHLGAEQRQGLEKFYEAAVRRGLAPAGRVPFRYAESVR
jgi:chorismate dehydratase